MLPYSCGVSKTVMPLLFLAGFIIFVIHSQSASKYYKNNTKEIGFGSRIVNDNIKTIPSSYIHIYDMQKPIDQSSNIPCFNATAYKPPIYLCIYEVANDKIVTGKLNSSKVWEKAIHNNIVDTLLKDESMGFIDIGANIGTHTIHVANLGRRVLAVEPIYDNYIRIHKSIVLNGLQDKITLVTNAVSDVREKVAFTIRDSHNKGTFFIDDKTENNENTNIQTILMDDLLEVTNITKAVLKIDIEGFEAHAFAKADKLFSQIDIPLVCIEFQAIRRHFRFPDSPGFKRVQALIDFFVTRGYTAYSVKGKKLDTDNWGSWPWDAKFIK